MCSAISEVQAETGFHDGTDVTRRLEVERIRLISRQRVRVGEDGIQHHVRVRGREAVRDDRQRDEALDLSVEALEPPFRFGPRLCLFLLGEGFFQLPENDVFYHFAWRGVNGPEKADPDIQIQNIQIAINAAKLAKMLSCKRFLCSGTIAERGLASLSHLQQTNGGMMYSAGKHSANLMLETYCKYIGLDFVWMQFSNIYGPGNRTGNLVSYTINKLSESCDAEFGPANQPYDFIYIDDLIEAVYRLGITKTKQCFYFIGSGRPRILKEYLFEIGELMNKKEKIRIGQRVDDGILYTEDMFDIAPLVSEIGHYVRNSFSVGIRKTIEDYY